LEDALSRFMIGVARLRGGCGGASRNCQPHRGKSRGEIPAARLRELLQWHVPLEKISQMCSGYLDQQAEGIVSMSRLKGKLMEVGERRTVAESELEKLTRHQEHIAELESDVEALVDTYCYQAREVLDLYTPQDRHDAYRKLGLNVIAHPDGSI
jgi:hypothetical protein